MTKLVGDYLSICLLIAFQEDFGSELYGNRDSEDEDDNDSFNDKDEDEVERTLRGKPSSHGEEEDEQEDELSKILRQRTVKFCDRPISRSGGHQVHAHS